MKSRVALTISTIVIIGLLMFIYTQRATTSPPPFHPFHIKTNFNYDDLISDGYTQVPVDVSMLGKTVGRLTMNYQIDEETNEIYWRNAIIDTQMSSVDTLAIYSLIESYQADIVLTSEIDSCRKIPPPLTLPFFVQHRINHRIFECVLAETSENHYDIMVSLESPIPDYRIVEQNNKLAFYRRKRFGPDTIVYENGEMKIENVWNWTREGEDKCLRPNGTLKKLSVYKNGELQNTKGFYENGQIEFDVLSFNMTGSSIWWYPNGAFKEIIKYKDGKRYGEHITYYRNGKIKLAGQYRGGFYDTGIKDGEWIDYDSLGNVKRKESYRHDSLVKSVRY